MKHFLIETQVNLGGSANNGKSEAEPSDVNFWQQGCDEGWLLLSAEATQTAGFLLARAESIEGLKQLLSTARNCTANAMRCERIIEFAPIQHQFFLRDWFGKYSG